MCMDGLYPIIRRIRRPLIVEEPAAAGVGSVSTSAELGQEKGAGPARTDPAPVAGDVKGATNAKRKSGR
jgi:hypothetical protein